MAIRSESELVWQQIKKALLFVLLLPWHFIEVLIHPHKLPKKIGSFFAWFKEPFKWLFETKVTGWLIILNVVVFVVSVVFFSEETFSKLVLYPEALVQGNVLSLFSSAFLHADLFHLGGNMLVLFIVGRVVEKHLQGKGMLLVYFGSIIISGLASALIYLFVFGDNTGAIGASGAIAGVTSAAILLSPFYFTYLLLGIPIPIILVGWLFITQDVLAILNPVAGDNVGHLAHLGGYIGVMLLVFFISSEGKKKMFAGLLVNVSIVIVTLLIYFLYASGAIALP